MFLIYYKLNLTMKSYLYLITLSILAYACKSSSVPTNNQAVKYYTVKALFFVPREFDLCEEDRINHIMYYQRRPCDNRSYAMLQLDRDYASSFSHGVFALYDYRNFKYFSYQFKGIEEDLIKSNQVNYFESLRCDTSKVILDTIYKQLRNCGLINEFQFKHSPKTIKKLHRHNVITSEIERGKVYMVSMRYHRQGKCKYYAPNKYRRIKSKYSSTVNYLPTETDFNLIDEVYSVRPIPTDSVMFYLKKKSFHNKE